MKPIGSPSLDTLFVFIDESGNFDFSHKGTRHFVMAGISALSPLTTATEMQSLRYQLLADGHDVQGFHASEDRQHVRDGVFAAMARMKEVTAHVAFGEKKLSSPHHQSDSALHALFSNSLLEMVVRTHEKDDFGQTVVIFDQALPKSKRGPFHATVKPRLKLLGKPFYLYFHPMISDMNGQLADYVAWSKFVELERSENRPWKSVTRHLNIAEHNVFGYKNDRPD